MPEIERNSALDLMRQRRRSRRVIHMVLSEPATLGGTFHDPGVIGTEAAMTFGLYSQ